MSTAELDVLNMSDEELMKLDPATLAQLQAGGVSPSADDADQDPDENQNPEDTTAPEADQADDEDDAEGEDRAESEEAGDEGADASDDDSDGQAEDGKKDTDEEEGKDPHSGEAKPAAEGKAEKPEGAEKDAEKKDESTEEVVTVDFEAEYKRLLAPFTANGREMSVKNVDEAITLMQMGANYNKKMAALKPSLSLLKMLESNGLADAEKISYLIDLANKDAGAINKLVKDSGIDPMDLSSEKADEYKPTKRTVSEKELELDSVLEEIQETPSYQRTLKVVGKEWDVKSRQIVADAPQLLKVINSHVQAGIYDMIVAEVERERMLGRLSGLTDIEAYRQVGDAIQARGGFDHLVASASNQGQQTPAKTVVVPPKPRQVDDSRLKDKRRAAAPSKPVVKSSPSPKDFNPLTMSDEEFQKLVKQDLL